MLDEQDISRVIGDMWKFHVAERGHLDKIGDYARGKRGKPAVPEASGQEIKDLAVLSVKNVLGLVVDSFAQNLSVTGYRTAAAQDNDPAWTIWQRNRLDARQSLVHVPALTYGAAYVTVIGSPADETGRAAPVITPRSPKQILTAYADPVSDEWPQYAMEMWTAQSGAKLRRRARLYDDTHLYELDLGDVPESVGGDVSTNRPPSVIAIDETRAHGATYGGVAVCPVVRFVNARDADGRIVGEVEPLISDQQAINAVNFDRLLVSRFGAFPQKVISGWAGSKNEVLAASAQRVWAFEDPDVKATTLQAGSTTDYNDVLDEMVQHVAMRAQISPAQVTGKMINVSAEALAAAEANQQRKLGSKRDGFGESWEQVMRLAAEMDGDPDTASDSGAEVVWRDTEARAFGAVVDGLTKLVAAGVPLEQVLQLVPGLSQQQVKGIKDSLRRDRMAALLDRAREVETAT